MRPDGTSSSSGKWARARRRGKASTDGDGRFGRCDRRRALVEARMGEVGPLTGSAAACASALSGESPPSPLSAGALDRSCLGISRSVLRWCC